MKKFILMAVICLSTTLQALAWGAKGHDIVAYVAEKNISRKALKNVTEVLDGHSVVYYSSWLDSASHTDEYKYTKTWHYRNVDKNHTPESMPLNEDGDVVRAVEDLTAQLKEGNLTREEEKVALMMLIHLVGDLHCPMHAGRLSDLGGNRRTVYFFGSKTNLHSIWDSAMIESAHKWSHTEWQFQLDRFSKEERKAIAAGTPDDWFKDSFEAASELYEATPNNARLSYDYITEFSPLLERQLMYGGIRLASLLNEIYG